MLFSRRDPKAMGRWYHPVAAERGHGQQPCDAAQKLPAQVAVGTVVENTLLDLLACDNQTTSEQIFDENEIVIVVHGVNTKTCTGISGACVT